MRVCVFAQRTVRKQSEAVQRQHGGHGPPGGIGSAAAGRYHLRTLHDCRGYANALWHQRDGGNPSPKVRPWPIAFFERGDSCRWNSHAAELPVIAEFVVPGRRATARSAKWICRQARACARVAVDWDLQSARECQSATRARLPLPFAPLSNRLVNRLAHHQVVSWQLQRRIGVAADDFLQCLVVIANLKIGELEAVGGRNHHHPVG